MKDGGNCYLMEDDSNCNHMYSLELTVLSEEIHPGSRVIWSPGAAASYTARHNITQGTLKDNNLDCWQLFSFHGFFQ